MNQFFNREDLITFLYNHITTFKDQPILKDTTKINKIKYDAYFDSSISAPLSFCVFELSDSAELIIDDPSKIIDSDAAFFIFVNPRLGWIFSIKNTLQNRKKLIRKEPIQNFKIKILD